MERHVTEYTAALEMLRYCSNLRRQDMVFVTTVQGAVISILGNKLLALDIGRFALSWIAFAVVLHGLNSERRNSAYRRGYLARALDLENQLGLLLVHTAKDEIARTRLLASNAYSFNTYYGMLALSWLVLWIVNM